MVEDREKIWTTIAIRATVGGMDDRRPVRDVLWAVLATTAFRMGALFGMRRYGPVPEPTARPRSVPLPPSLQASATTRRPRPQPLASISDPVVGTVIGRRKRWPRRKPARRDPLVHVHS